MKILFLSNSLEATYRFRYWMIRRLAEDGNRVIIACPFDVELLPLKKNIEYIEIPFNGKSTSLVDNLHLFYKFAKLAMQVRPNLSLFYSNKPALFAPIVFKLIKTYSVSINTGFGSGFLMLKKKSNLVNKVVKFFLHFSDLVIVLNKEDYRYLLNKVKISKDKLFILPGEGVNINEFKYNPPSERCEFVKFIFIGRLLLDKGVIELIKAFDLLNKKYYGYFDLTIVGSTDSTHPKSITEENLSLIKNSEYTNYIRHTNNIAEVLSNSDVFVLPSYREGLSRAAMEACAIGRPLVVSDVAGLRDLVQNEVNGFLCNSKDYFSLFLALEKCMKASKKRLLKMGEESYLSILGKHDNDTIYNEFNSIIDILNSSDS